jgi:hypothetical protein
MVALSTLRQRRGVKDCRKSTGGSLLGHNELCACGIRIIIRMILDIL